MPSTIGARGRARLGSTQESGEKGVTAAARRYLAPLIVGEAYPPFKNGLPDHVKLRNVAAPKKLNTEFAV